LGGESRASRKSRRRSSGSSSRGVVRTAAVRVQKTPAYVPAAWELHTTNAAARGRARSALGCLLARACARLRCAKPAAARLRRASSRSMQQLASKF
jgi:hypothetical protein